MKTGMKIATIAVAGLAAAGICTPPAHAEGCSMPNCYGAMAWTPSTGSAHASANLESQAEADARAVSKCNAEQGVSNCRVVVRLAGAGCMSVTSNGSSGTGSTQAAANAAALRGGGSLLSGEEPNVNPADSPNCNG